jgi:hypothetical protein
MSHEAEPEMKSRASQPRGTGRDGFTMMQIRVPALTVTNGPSRRAESACAIVSWPPDRQE